MDSIAPLSVNSSLFSWRGFFSFLLGFSACYQVNFIGSLSLQEILFAVAFPLLLVQNLHSWPKFLTYVFLSLLTWLLVQFGTDLIRQIPFEDSARGCARIVFFAFGFGTFYLYFKDNLNNVALFLFGLCLNFIVAYYLFPTEASLIDPWKWSFSLAVSMLALGVLCFFNSPSFVWAILLLFIAFYSAMNNYRSHAAILLLVALRISFERFFLRLPVWLRLGVILAQGVAVLSLYVVLASGGMLGEEARKKVDAQFDEEKGIVSVITQGRAEFRASSRAIADSPLLGYGSWARHPEYVYELWTDDSGLSAADYSSMVELGVIPTHSFLFGAWVDGGILPALFWLVAWFTCLYIFVQIRTNRGWLPKLALYVSVILLWDILFSPFGLGARAFAAFSIAIVCLAAIYWVPVKKHYVGRRG